MKSILLTTTAMVAFAGAAAAGGHTSVGFGGDVTFGVNGINIECFHITGGLGTSRYNERNNSDNRKNKQLVFFHR